MSELFATLSVGLIHERQQCHLRCFAVFWCSFAHLFPIQLIHLCVIGVSVSNGTQYNLYRLWGSTHDWLFCSEGKASQMGVKIAARKMLCINACHYVLILQIMLTINVCFHTIHTIQWNFLSKAFFYSKKCIFLYNVI